VLIGALGGLLGALFNWLWFKLNHYRLNYYARAARRNKSGQAIKVDAQVKLLEVAVLSIITSFVTYFVPIAAGWVCITSHDKHELAEFRFNCGEGHINEMGLVLFGSREHAIKNIIDDPDSYNPLTLLTVGITVFSLMLLTFGVAVPAGIFMPTILTGASLGGFLAHLVRTLHGSHITSSTYALLGSAAMLAGIQRSTVSLCVILMEGTGKTEILIPVIITVVVAKIVGDLFTEGLYEISIELKQLPYLEHKAKGEYDIYTAAEIMTSPPETIAAEEKAGYIENLLKRTSHNGFPVVDDRNSKKYLGLVRRDQLVALLESEVFMEEAEVNVFKKVAISMPLIRTLNVRDDHFTRHRRRTTAHPPTNDFTVVRIGDNDLLMVDLATQHAHKRINVAAVMNKATGCVNSTTPVSKAYMAFTQLGLRHLCVLGGDTGGEVVGVITRENLLRDHIEMRTERDLCPLC